MWRNIVAVVTGVIAGMALNMAVIRLNFSVFFPVPAGVDTDVLAQFNAFLSALPDSAFVLVLLAHVSQSLLGAWVAARMGESHPMRLALIVGVVALAGGIKAMEMLEGPEWLVIEFPLYIAAAWLAGMLEQRRRAQCPPSEH